MTLNVNITKVKDWKNHCLQDVPEEEKDLMTMRLRPDRDHFYNPVTESLVFLAMSCGFSEITKKNWRTVARRVAEFERTFGPFLQDSKERYLPITAAQVERHIGLYVNATPLTDAQFKKSIRKRAVEELQRQWRAKMEDKVADALLAADNGIDYEEIYYKFQRELESEGYEIDRFDEAMDNNEDGPNELLERYDRGEGSAVELASEYEYIDG